MSMQGEKAMSYTEASCCHTGGSYYTGTKNYFPKPLSEQEEAEWIEKFFSGSDKEKEQARNVLIEHNLRLVAHVAKKYASATLPAEELISVGTIGLIKAVSTFKADKGNKLGTYAVRCIENATLTRMSF